jgi:DNA-binding NtrC family response regulator
MSTKPFPENPVLIIDDESNILDAMEFMLINEGIDHLILSNDSAEAIDVLREQSVSVVIVDLKMPGITGDKLIVYIKNHFSHIPVIVTTGFPEGDPLVLRVKPLVYAFFFKPVDNLKLVEAILGAIGTFPA